MGSPVEMFWVWVVNDGKNRCSLMFKMPFRIVRGNHLIDYVNLDRGVYHQRHFLWRIHWNHAIFHNPRSSCWLTLIFTTDTLGLMCFGFIRYLASSTHEGNGQITRNDMAIPKNYVNVWKLRMQERCRLRHLAISQTVSIGLVGKSGGHRLIARTRSSPLV